MVNLEFQPKMVGRENELNELQTYLDKAAGGEGSTVFISGEAGIGKTRLVEELKQIAQSRGFHILSGNCMYESLTPFMPIMEALRSGGLESLFAEEAPKVEAVYLVTHSGLLIKEVVRQETRLDPDLFSSVLITLSEFASQSLLALLGEEKEGTLNSIGFKNYRILIESRKNMNLVIIISGKENEFLINDKRDIFSKVNKSYGNVLDDWDGDEANVKGIEKFLEPLITSGKYDGIYYGKDDPKARRNLLFENVSLGLTRYAQTTPTLLCIEDLQWIDPSSLALMHYIARNTRKHGLVILGTYRPEDVTAMDGKGHPLVGTMQLMEREDLYEKMELGRLQEGNIDEFLHALLGKTDFSDEFKDRIYRETEGNPLFVIQLVKFLVDEKIISSDEETWRLAKELRDIEIPSKIIHVIERRLNRLEKEDRKVLDYASVIGEMFNSSVLTDALDTNRTKLLEQLRGLEQTHRLIHSHNGNFKFDHAKIKEVLYSEIPKELRMDYHSTIANSIEIMNMDNLEEVIEDLAFHYYQCKNKEKALHYLIKAAEKAKKDYSNEEAIRFYNEALELEEDMQKKMDLLEGLGDVYQLTGAYKKSIASYNKILDLTQKKNKIAEIKVKIGYSFNRIGEYDESIRICNEAQNVVKGEMCKEKALALQQISFTYLRRGNFERSLEYAEKSLEMSQKIGDMGIVGDSLNIIGLINEHRGECDRSLVHLKKALAINKKIDDQRGIASRLNSIGIVYYQMGEYKKALECHKNSKIIKEKIGDQYGIVGSFINIGLVHLRRGEYDRAHDHLKKSLEISEKMGEPDGIAISLVNIGETYLRKGEYEKALNFYDRSLAIEKRISLLRPMTYSYRGIAETYLKKGSFQDSLDFANRTLDLSLKIGIRENVAYARMIFGMIFREQRKWKESIDEFNESLKIFNEIGMKLESAESHFEFGLMWKAKGDVDKAKEHFQQALDMFEELKIEKKAEMVKAALNEL